MDIVNEGRHAAEIGVGENGNPYKEGQWQYVLWLAGWHSFSGGVVSKRRGVEVEIVSFLVEELLGAGCFITIEESEVEKCDDRDRLLGNVFDRDEETLIVYRGERLIGWVDLVYGNDGFDVIADYSLNLEPCMSNVFEYIETLEERA